MEYIIKSPEKAHMSLAQFSERYVVAFNIQFNNNTNSWMVSAYNIEISEGGVLKSIFGSGPTPPSAVEDWMNEHNNRPLVKNAYSKSRKNLGRICFSHIGTATDPFVRDLMNIGDCHEGRSGSV